MKGSFRVRSVAGRGFWNHLGNVVSLAGIYVATVAFGLNGVIGLMVLHGDRRRRGSDCDRSQEDQS